MFFLTTGSESPVLSKTMFYNVLRECYVNATGKCVLVFVLSQLGSECHSGGDACMCVYL